MADMYPVWHLKEEVFLFFIFNFVVKLIDFETDDLGHPGSFFVVCVCSLPIRKDVHFVGLFFIKRVKV